MSGLALPVLVMAMGLASAWLLAAVWYPVWTRCLRRWPALGRVSLVAACLPMLLGLTVVFAALIPGDPHLSQPFGCHCHTSMPGWIHLCPVHPASAAGLLPVALLVAGLLLPGRIGAVRALVAEPLGLGGSAEPQVLDLPGQTAVLVGWWRPTLVVDRTLWQALDADERGAVLAHEGAHLARRDPWVLMAHRLLVSVGPASSGRALTRAWLAGAELRADAIAAEEVGSERLASALVRCARLASGVPPLAPCWTGGQLERRIEALLSGEGVRSSSAPDAGLLDAAVVLALALWALSTSPWLHHQVEHLLNLSL